jgi:hypothetical protein
MGEGNPRRKRSVGPARRPHHLNRRPADAIDGIVASAARFFTSHAGVAVVEADEDCHRVICSTPSDVKLYDSYQSMPFIIWKVRVVFLW